MESQISTGTHHGPGLDVPEQGLHLRRSKGSWHGVLDTSMGPVEMYARTMPAGEQVGQDEIVLGVPEQFVALRRDGNSMTGSIDTEAGPVLFSSRG